MKINTILFINIILIFLSGCTKYVSTPVEVYIPVKCDIPKIENPKLHKIYNHDNNRDIIRKTMENYKELEYNNKQLKSALDICRKESDKEIK